MDTRVPADDGGWPSPAGSRAGAGSIEQRLAAIEARLDSLERAVTETVADELHSAGDELRRAVSDLGRLLLRDLDRLTKVLAEHRDAIVERVTAVTAVAGGAAAEPVTGNRAEDVERPPPPPGEAPGAAEAAEASGGDAPARRGEEGRWRAVPGRRKGRRSPPADRGGDTRNG